MDEFRRAVFDIAAEHRPCSGRQVYYRAVVAGLIDKDTAGTRKNEARIGRVLNEQRERWLDYRPGGADRQEWLDAWRCSREAWWDGEPTADQLTEMTCRMLGDVMPFGWITDNTRTRYQSDVWADKDAAISDMIRFYRRDLWRMQPRRVEVWCESESIAGVLLEECDAYGVALLPCRGQAPKRFVYDSAQSYDRTGKPVTVLYVGDFDPNGLDIGNSVRDRIYRYLPPDSSVDVDFRRIAITADQVSTGRLPGHGLNPNIARGVLDRFLSECAAYGIPGEAVEAEAMPPGELRTLVAAAITEHIDERQWETEIAIEREERRSLANMLGETP